MGQVLAVTSGKGGTGKTTVCAALASCLAAEGKRVLCIDGDIGLRNLDIYLGMSELAPISFLDVLEGRYQLSDACPQPEIPGLYLLTSPLADRPGAIAFRDFEQLLQAARAQFDFCLIDSPAGLGDGFRLCTMFADRVLVVAAPDPASMRDAACVAEQLLLGGKNDVKLIVNRVTRKLFRRLKLTVDDVMDSVGLSLLGLVPEDQNVVLAAAANRPLILFTDQGAALGCLHIARRLCGTRIPLLYSR